MSTPTPRLWLFALVLLTPLAACKREAETTPPTPASATQPAADEAEHHPDLEGREVVDNWEAQTGDVTVCPMSGNKFEVTDESGRFAYQGYEFVFCCTGCLTKVEADPGKYLDALVEEAGGPAGGPASGE